MMELSEADILRLTSLGFKREGICTIGKDGIPRLRNVKGSCVFLSDDGRTCTVYDNRPLGCDIYPVNCDEDGDIFVDEFCRARETISKDELLQKGTRLQHHLHIIDAEAKDRMRTRR
jgi:Fe-S-cluster containining protein